MLLDIQKPGIMRRVAAGLFDMIILIVLATGIGWGVSAVIDTDSQYAAVQEFYTIYSEEYGVDFSLTTEDLEAMSEEEQAKYNEAYEAALAAMNEDQDAIDAMLQYWASVLSVISLSVFIAHLLLEFVVPLTLKNGQTLGKKVFGIALMRKDGVMVAPIALFVRSMLGKCTIEVMIPILILGLTLMGMTGILIYLVLALAIAQVVLLVLHPYNCLLHDLMACTVSVDLSSQLIFRTPEALTAYQKEQAARRAQNADY